MMRIAHTLAMRATCDRLYVGAVLAMDGRIISTGFNGAPSGEPHCDHRHSTTPCTASVHAETNAIVFAARHGISAQGATLYSTHAPCASCAATLINLRIERCLYANQYRSDAGLIRLLTAGITVEHWPALPHTQAPTHTPPAQLVR